MMTELASTFVVRVFTMTEGLKHNPGRMLLIVRRPYAHLEDQLRRAFEGRDDVVVIHDRRRGARRRSAGAAREERRQAERRSSQEDVLEVVIEGYRSGPGKPGPPRPELPPPTFRTSANGGSCMGIVA
jgi:hypothetical protein